MSAQHTPGPWTVHVGHYAGRVVRGAGTWLVGASISSEHDARLIAAAPELLAALRALVAAVEDPDADSLRQLIAAHAAIAKATGDKS